MKDSRKFFFLIYLFLFLGSLSCHRLASDLKIPVKKIVLDNGFTALLVSHDGAPVFSGYLRIKVGNIEEPLGFSGLAHFFEHMAFKGTTLIGETEPNEFVRIYQRNGGADINATTTNDYTSYFVSLPSNKLELWAYLESERLLHPVFREFEKERDVVAEERRMRYDNSPEGHLYEELMLTAFDTSPYKNPVIGYANEIQSYTFEAAKNFRDTYYVPSRMVLALVGNFDVNQVEKIVRQYFGKLPAKELSDKPILGQDFSKNFPRKKIIATVDEPRFYLAFHRPAFPHEDDEVFDVLQNLLCEGRTSRLYRVLVIEKKLASQIGCYGAIPGSRLDSLFTFYAEPFSGVANQKVWEEIIGQLESIMKIPVSQKELAKVVNHIDADLLWTLKENMGLASMLTFFESLSGDWRYVYRLRERIRQMTPEDVMRVASTYFVPERRVSVFMEKEDQ